MHFILHNRQTKMIGGDLDSFRAFDGRKEVGSAWVPNDTYESILQVERQAEEILTFHPSVIVGLFEQFEQTLCVLEVVYGDQRRFTWDPKMHSHHTGRRYNTKETEDLIIRYRNGSYGMVYANWQQKNRADQMLYEASTRLFSLQFNAALTVLRESGLGVEYVRTHTPHCLPFFRGDA